MKALFLVRGPLHIINMLEAIKHFRITESVCYLFLNDDVSGDKYKEQSLKLLDGLKDIKIIETRTSPSSSLYERIQVYGQHINAFMAHNFDYVFFTDPRVHWQKDIVTTLDKPTYMIDEGNLTIVTYELLKRRKKYFNFPQVVNTERQALANQIKQQFGIKEVNEFKYNLFTFLSKLPRIDNIDIDIQENRLSNLKKYWDKLDDSRHIIVGCSYCHTFNLEEDTYIKLIQCMVREDKTTLYIPHPNALPTTLKKLKANIPNLLIHPLNEPIEIWLSRQSMPPASLSSFYSSVISTTCKAFPQIDINCYKLPHEILNLFNRRNVWGIDNLDFYEFVSWIYLHLGRQLPILSLPNQPDNWIK